MRTIRFLDYDWNLNDVKSWGFDGFPHV